MFVMHGPIQVCHLSGLRSQFSCATRMHSSDALSTHPSNQRAACTALGKERRHLLHRDREVLTRRMAADNNFSTMTGRLLAAVQPSLQNAPFVLLLLPCAANKPI
jgi:hypothetical protein